MRPTYIILFLLLLSACNKKVNISFLEETIELQAWVKINGGILKDGELLLKEGNGSVCVANLNWSQIDAFRSDKFVFYSIPLQLNNSITNSSKKEYSSFKLILQKNGKDIFGFISQMILPENSTTESYHKFETISDLKGKNISNWIWKTSEVKIPQRIYRKNDATLFVSSSSVKKNSTCDSYFIPIKDYHCWSSSTTSDPNNNTICGYVTVGLSAFSICFPPPYESFPDPIEYGEYYEFIASGAVNSVDPWSPENDLPLPCESPEDHSQIDTLITDNERVQEAFKYILPPEFCQFISFDQNGILNTVALNSAKNTPGIGNSIMYDILEYCANSNFTIRLSVASSWRGKIGQDTIVRNYSWESQEQSLTGITVMPGTIPNIQGVPVTGSSNESWIFIRNGQESSNQRLAFIVVHELLGHCYEFLKKEAYSHGDPKFDNWVAFVEGQAAKNWRMIKKFKKGKDVCY